MTVKNHTDSTKTFMSMVPEIYPYFNGEKMDTKIISTTCRIYQGSAVFNKINNADDLTDKVLEPLASRNGYIAFSVPKNSINSDNPLIFRIERDGAGFDFIVEF